MTARGVTGAAAAAAGAGCAPGFVGRQRLPPTSLPFIHVSPAAHLPEPHNGCPESAHLPPQQLVRVALPHTVLEVHALKEEYPVAESHAVAAGWVG